MDAGGNGNPGYKRQFPSLTDAQLKAAIFDYETGTNPNVAYMTKDQVNDQIVRMRIEMVAREAGVSKVYRVPQI
jgi:hypothetical protein